MINLDGLAEDFPIENGVIYHSEDNKDTLEYSSGSNMGAEMPAATFFIEDSIKSDSESSKCKSSEKSKDSDHEDEDEDEIDNAQQDNFKSRKTIKNRESTHIIPFLQQQLREE